MPNISFLLYIYVSKKPSLINAFKETTKKELGSPTYPTRIKLYIIEDTYDLNKKKSKNKILVILIKKILIRPSIEYITSLFFYQ